MKLLYIACSQLYLQCNNRRQCPTQTRPRNNNPGSLIHSQNLDNMILNLPRHSKKIQIEPLMYKTSLTLYIRNLFITKILYPILNINSTPQRYNYYIFLLHVTYICHNICQCEIYVFYVSQFQGWLFFADFAGPIENLLLGAVCYGGKTVQGSGPLFCVLGLSGNEGEEDDEQDEDWFHGLSTQIYNYEICHSIIFQHIIVDEHTQKMQKLSCIQSTICKILSKGQIPFHIGFIMDGNRRHAKKNRYTSTHQGHIEGVKSLKKCLLICKQIGIKQISLFAFSVQNFNRSKQQVDKLMQLCLRTFDQMSEMCQMLLANQIKVNIIGRKDMLNQAVRNAFQKIQQKTKQYTKIVVNLCFAYDSIHQVQTSIQKMQKPSYTNFINNLAIPNHLDILVRTANQYRLSNFMLPQAAYAYICILKENWPQINLVCFCKIMLAYNYHQKDITRNRKIINQKIHKKCDVQEQRIGLVSETEVEDNIKKD